MISPQALGVDHANYRLHHHRHSLPPPLPNSRRWSFHRALEKKGSENNHSNNSSNQQSNVSLVSTDRDSIDSAICIDVNPEEYRAAVQREIRRKSDIFPIVFDDTRQQIIHLQEELERLQAEERRSLRVRKSTTKDKREEEIEVGGGSLNHRLSDGYNKGGTQSGTTKTHQSDTANSSRSMSPLPTRTNMRSLHMELFGNSKLAGGCQTILVMGPKGSGKSSLVGALKFQERFEEKEMRNIKRSYIEIDSDHDDLWRTLSGIVVILVVFMSDNDKSLKFANETLLTLYSSSVASPVVLVATKMETKNKNTIQNAEKVGKRMNTSVVEVSARLHNNINILSGMIREFAEEQNIGTQLEKCSLITDGLRHFDKTPKRTFKTELERKKSSGRNLPERGNLGIANLLVPNGAPIFHLATTKQPSNLLRPPL